MVILDAVKVEAPQLNHAIAASKREWRETSAALEMAWIARENARKLVGTPPSRKNAWKTSRTVCVTPRKMMDAAVHSCFEEHVAETEKLPAENDQRGFCKHLKGTVEIGEKKAMSGQFSLGMGMVPCSATRCALVNSMRGVLPQTPEHKIADVRSHHHRAIPQTTTRTVAWE